MARPVPPTVDDVRLCASRMANNAADALSLVETFGDLVEQMQPADALLRSRPEFQRGALWSYPALFENVGRTDAPLVVLKAQTDLWVRGVNCTVISGFADTFQPQVLQELARTFGSNSRWLIECKWRLDERQGFIARGITETLGPATLLCGDGEYNAPLDWVIEKDQTLEVTMRSLVSTFFPLPDQPPFEDLPPIRAVWITFWGEDLRGEIGRGAGRVRR